MTHRFIIIQQTGGTPQVALIILWSGSIASIPTGYQLCDGTNGTPNLQDKFIAAEYPDFHGDGIGGADTRDRTHWHTNTQTGVEGSHNHPIAAWISGTVNTGVRGAGAAGTAVGNDHTHDYAEQNTTTDTGGLSDHQHGASATTTVNLSGEDSRPAYYALAYISGQIAASDVPLNGIVHYAGDSADIPSGYQVCDGTNGTPDLSDWNVFIIGAGSTYAVGDSDPNHYTFTESDFAHTHAAGTVAIGNESAHTHALDVTESTYSSSVLADNNVSGFYPSDPHAHSGGPTGTGAGEAHNHPSPTPGGTIRIQETDTLPTFYLLGFLMRLS